MNQRPADRFGGCTHPPVERHSVVVPSPGPTFEIRRTLRRMAAGFAESPGLDCFVTIWNGREAWEYPGLPRLQPEKMEAHSCGALPARLGDALIVPSKMRVRFLT